jgi:paraquat-inducible protein B
MSKPVGKSLIGAFVLGALVLAVAAVMVFGSGKFLTKTLRYVMYFEGSVKGLNIGSPVMFRGVKIGSVTDVQLILDPTNLKFVISVYSELDPSKMRSTDPGRAEGQHAYLQPLIDRGMRAQLETQSFVTGQLMINLDFFPDTPARFVHLDKHIREVPTIPSTLEQLSKDIQSLPWKDLFENAHAAVKGIDKLVNSPAMASTTKNMDQTLNEAKKALQSINEQMGPILANIQETTVLVRTSAAKVDEALSGEKGIPAQLQITFEAVQKALAQTDSTLQKVEDIATENSWLATQAGETMDKLGKAGAALRVLADFLERHPEALIRGKKAP